MTYRHIALSAFAAAAITLTGCGGGSSSTPSTTEDTVKPVVTLTGTATVNLTVGDLYTDAGATANDDVDGVLTPTASGTVDPDTAGTYTMTYSATDTAGNTGTATRTVVVAPVDTPEAQKLPAEITTDMTLTNDRIWYFEGKVVVTNGATLTIEPGTTVAGREGDGDATSYMIIDKGSKIMAEGTEAQHIIFTSTKVALDGDTADVGQWGGITIIGKAANPQVKPYEADTAFVAESTDMADNSGVLKYVEVLNSGITKATDEEFNGLSMVGVGSGTTVDHIIVNKSDDDCMELWGGTVNVSNVDLSECTDDHFDIDDGYAGTVTNLKIVGTIGHSGIEMSGDTAATFNGFDITMNDSATTEGGIYFKGDGIGGDFSNGTVTNNVDNGFGAIHSTDGATVDIANTAFTGVTLAGTSPDKFTGGSAVALEDAFDAGTDNNK